MQIEHTGPIETIWPNVDVLVTFEQSVREHDQYQLKTDIDDYVTWSTYKWLTHHTRLISINPTILLRLLLIELRSRALKSQLFQGETWIRVLLANIIIND